MTAVSDPIIGTTQIVILYHKEVSVCIYIHVRRHMQCINEDTCNVLIKAHAMY